MTIKHLLVLVLFTLIEQPSWAATPSSTNILLPTTNPMPQTGIILATGILPSQPTKFLRCGWATSGSSNYNRYDDPACNGGTQVTTTLCPSRLMYYVTIALVTYQTCSGANMYGIALDLPSIEVKNGGYALYWKQSDNKHLYAGYNNCDDRPVKVAYVVYCN